jgi:hypothetical protein
MGILQLLVSQLTVDWPLHPTGICYPPDLGAKSDEVSIRAIFQRGDTTIRTLWGITFRAIAWGLGGKIRLVRRRRGGTKSAINFSGGRGANQASTIGYFAARGVRAVKGWAKLIVTVGRRVELDRGLGRRVSLTGAAWRTWYAEAIISPTSERSSREACSQEAATTSVAAL